MKKFAAIVFLGLSCCLASFPIFAEDTAESNHVPVGVRAEAQEARQVEEKTREEKAAKYLQENGSKGEASVKGSAMKSMAKKSLGKSLYYTTHPGAYHNPVAISIFGDTVETEDGTIWTVAPKDAYVTLNWLVTDLVVITPNHSWFSPYTFRLTNQATGESVAANIYLGPIYNGLHTHWIVGIDYYHNTVYLEDGSIWQMSYFDDHVVNKWLVNDTVIIGVNDSWLSSSKPNILINVNMLNYAAGVAAY